MPIKAFKKKSVTIKAIQFNGYNIDECIQFIKSGGGNCFKVHINKLYSGSTEWEIDIETLEGIMRVKKGDYIIRGVNGEYYPCKPGIFEKTYEKVKEF